jgi:mRNA-degrading endonuclease RelE of RelBE toxin-antitoxin system
MRSSREKTPAAAYTVDISPEAWRQLATLPADDYGRIRAKLDALANELTSTQTSPWSAPGQEGPGANARASILEGFAVLYGVDRERRRLTVLEVTRRLPPEE